MLSYEVFQQFLKDQSRVTRNDHTGTSPIKPASGTTSSVGVGGFKKKTRHASVFVANRTDNCGLYGKSSHPLYLCASFQKATLDQRWEMKQQKTCSNCLSIDLPTEECRSTK